MTSLPHYTTATLASLNKLELLLPQGLCTGCFLCLECSYLSFSIASLLSFTSLLKWQFFSEAFPSSFTGHRKFPLVKIQQVVDLIAFFYSSYFNNFLEVIITPEFPTPSLFLILAHVLYLFPYFDCLLLLNICLMRAEVFLLCSL